MGAFPSQKIWPSAGQDRLWAPLNESREFTWEAVEELGWETQFATPIGVELPERTKVVGRKALLSMGIPEGSWFACIHVRSGGFWNDKTDDRNADIYNYLPMILDIVSAGGHVVRMGDSSMTPLPILKNVHDYALGPLRSATVDAYLIKSCRFFVGMQSGLQATAVLFERPMLITNAYTPFGGGPCRRDERWMFKAFHDRATGKSIDPVDLVCRWEEMDLLVGADSVLRSLYTVENTPEELSYAVRQFMDALELSFPEGPDHPRDFEFRMKLCAYIESLGATDSGSDQLPTQFFLGTALTTGVLSRTYKLPSS